MAYEVDYSPLDRLLHRIAFSTPAIQSVATDIEDTLFGADYASAQAERPIFITSLPRAGTTLLLEVLHRFPSLASHIYRDMPFVMAPVLWSRLSGAFRKHAEMNERAHGDGMQIGYDSPEAFEEILWKAFWPEKYANSGIDLWTAADADPEAQAKFAAHMKKIVALRCPDRMRDGRYISKNNANVARLDLIGHMFPGARILVPVRHPVAHAASLLRQHSNFIEMHRKEPFVRRYMADIGHYEFGGLHRPIAFPGLDALLAGRDPSTVDYWLAYWIAAFEHVLSRRDAIVLIPYEEACADGEATVADLCARLAIAEDGMREEAAALFREPTPHRADDAAMDPALRDRAEALHRALVAAAG